MKRRINKEKKVMEKEGGPITSLIEEKKRNTELAIENKEISEEFERK